MRTFRSAFLARALPSTSLVLALLSIGLASAAETHVPLNMTFSAPVDKVYAALVQSAGVGLKTTAKEACVVNFQATRNKLLIFDINANCRDVGNGQTLVALTIQHDPRSKQIFRTTGEQDKFLKVFWSDMEGSVKLNKTARNSETVPEQVASIPPGELGTVTIRSTPDGAEINVDGKFSGNAPATLRLSAGDHTLKVVSKGFQGWERNMTVTAGGAATINAILDPTQ